MRVGIAVVIAAWVSAGFGSRVIAQANEAEPLVTEGIVKAPVADVWSVFATAEGFKKLGVAHCDLDLRIGGVIRSHYDPKGTLGDDGTIHNEILAYEPLRMMSIRVHKPPKGFPFSEATWRPTWSVITLADLGDGRTHVRIAGFGYPDTEEGRKMRAFFKGGNAWVVDYLKKAYDAAAPAPAAQVHPAATVSPIACERVIERPRADVWKSLATRAGWKQFLGVEAAVELIPGGKFEIFFDAGAPPGKRGSEGCTVLSFVPEEMLSFTWNAPPKFAHARGRHTFVVVRFDELSATRTRVRLDHLGFAEQAAANPDHRGEWESTREYFASAWQNVLDALGK